MRTFRGPTIACLALAVCLGVRSPTARAVRLLPDLIAIEGSQFNAMQDGAFTTQLNSPKSQYRSLYQFTAAIPNIGDGPFEIREETDAEGTQTVYHRIYDSEGGVEEKMVGVFPNAEPGFGHLFLVGLAQYNLRTVIPDTGSGLGVGPIVASHDKTSFGLVDSFAHDPDLPNAPAAREYLSPNSEMLGVSVGWADLYGKGLPGQYVDATGLPDGQYWLEVVIDPYDYIEEVNEDNNEIQVLVDLIVPEPAKEPADFNLDDQVDAADRAAWEQHFGDTRGVEHADGDADCDRAVTGRDLLWWQRQLAPGAQLAAIPEPSAIGLIASALATALMPRGRRPRSPQR